MRFEPRLTINKPVALSTRRNGRVKGDFWVLVAGYAVNLFPNKYKPTANRYSILPYSSWNRSFQKKPTGRLCPRRRECKHFLWCNRPKHPYDAPYNRCNHARVHRRCRAHRKANRCKRERKFHCCRRDDDGEWTSAPAKRCRQATRRTKQLFVS